VSKNEISMRKYSGGTAQLRTSEGTLINIHRLSQQVKELWIPLTPTAATFLPKFCNAITRQPIELECCSNHLPIRQVFWLRLQKFLFVLGLGSMWGTSQVGMFLRFFGQLFATLSANLMSHFLAQVFLKIRQSSEALEPLIDFLACLKPKWWPKKQKLVKQIIPQTLTWVYYTHIIYGHNSPAAWARVLSKPSIDGESLIL